LKAQGNQELNPICENVQTVPSLNKGKNVCKENEKAQNAKIRHTDLHFSLSFFWTILGEPP